MKNLKSPDPTIDYYSEFSEQWEKSHDITHFWGKMMRTFHRLSPKGTILEIGCGAGRDAKILIDLGYDYTGIDPALGMIKRAKSKKLNGKFLKLGVEEIDFENEFDSFWATASLLHIPKKRIDEALKRINKALKIGGVGFITLKKYINDGPEERLESDENGSRFFAYWLEEEFTDVLKRNGFEIVVFEEEVKKERNWLKFIVRKSN